MARSRSQPNKWACWEREVPWPTGRPTGRPRNGEKMTQKMQLQLPRPPSSSQDKVVASDSENFQGTHTLRKLVAPQAHLPPAKTTELQNALLQRQGKLPKVVQSAFSFQQRLNTGSSVREYRLVSWLVKPAVIYYTAFSQLLTKLILQYWVNGVKTCHHEVYSTDVSCLPLKQLRNNQKWIRIIESRHGKLRY